MPKINQSFTSRPTIYKTSVAVEPKVSIPELHLDIVYANTADTTMENGRIYSDIVYANTAKTTTPRDIFNSIKKRIPEAVGQFSEAIFLELFQQQIALFTAMGSHKWNFLTIRQTLNMQPGQLEYDLPDNYDQMIAVWYQKDNKLNEYFGVRKTEVIQVDTQKSDFVSGKNYFEVVGGKLRFIKLGLNEALDNCNHCKKCNHCNSVEGKVELHYHITPPAPQTIDEEMHWFPQHPSALEYFKEKLREVIYERQGQAPYISPTADVFFNNLMKWDSNYWPVVNKVQHDTIGIDFSNILGGR
jgi:hypothetical protein